MVGFVGKALKGARVIFSRAINSPETPQPDEERGDGPAASHGGTQDSTPPRRPAPPLRLFTNEPDTLVPAEDKLLIFQTLTGIDTAPVVTRSGHSVRTANNIGIYTRVVRNERWTKKTARVVSALSNICLGLQIVMGAAVTAAAASRASYSNITGLGAVATITASIVAYVRGSGQPEKLRHEESRWKWVREYMEQRERELCLADSGLDAREEVRKIEEMFSQVKDEVEGEDRGDQEPGGKFCRCQCQTASADEGGQSLPTAEEIVAQVIEPEEGTGGTTSKQHGEEVPS